MPAYQLDILIRYMHPLEAHEQRNAITAATAPHSKPFARSTLMRSLDKLAAQLDPPPPPAPPREYVEINREKAAEWFASQGVNVVAKEVESA
jgi:hypothetical protein